MRFVLAALALLPLAASAAPTVVVPAPALLAACAEVGTHELKWPNGSSTVTSCKRFWQQGTRPAIRVPDDTARVVYGTVADYALPGGGTGGGGLTPGTGGGGSLPPLGGGRLRGRQSTPPTDNTPTTEFWTRAGKALSVKNGIVPADADRRDFSQIIFKGYVNAKGVVTRIEPAIFIETEAVLRPHMNTFYGGIVENWTPPKGVPTSNIIFVNFGSTLNVDGAGEATLRGSVPNRFVPKTRGNTWCKFLSVNNRTKAYYKEIMGPQNTANLTWSPGMHGFFDSEIVMHFNKRDTSYMTAGPKILNLITTSYRPLWKKYEFLAHGNPMGQIVRMNITLRKGKKACAKQTVLNY